LFGNGGSEVGKEECRRKKRAKEVTNYWGEECGKRGCERVATIGRETIKGSALRKGRTLMRRWKRDGEMGKEKHPRYRITRASEGPNFRATLRHEGGLVGGLTGREGLERLRGDEAEQTTEVAGERLG